jgi:hypothetical protein
MWDWKVAIAIGTTFVAFLLSPMLFPQLTEKLMWAWLATLGVGGIGLPALRIVRGVD